MATVLVIGASRGTGLAVVRAALSAGHRVRGLARHVDEPPVTDRGLEWVAGDATDAGGLARALDGVDCVVMALGIGRRPVTARRGVTLFSSATAALLPAMHAAGVRRLIAVTGFGAGASRAKISALEYLPFRLAVGAAYDDKDRQEAMIEASRLDWTIVRPGKLTNGPGGGRYRVLVEPATWHYGLIARNDVAHFIMAEIAQPAHVGKAPVLVY